MSGSESSNLATLSQVTLAVVAVISLSGAAVYFVSTQAAKAEEVARDVLSVQNDVHRLSVSYSAVQDNVGRLQDNVGRLQSDVHRLSESYLAVQADVHSLKETSAILQTGQAQLKSDIVKILELLKAEAEARAAEAEAKARAAAEEKRDEDSG